MSVSSPSSSSFSSLLPVPTAVTTTYSVDPATLQLKEEKAELSQSSLPSSPSHASSTPSCQLVLDINISTPVTSFSPSCLTLPSAPPSSDAFHLDDLSAHFDWGCGGEGGAEREGGMMALEWPVDFGSAAEESSSDVSNTLNKVLVR